MPRTHSPDEKAIGARLRAYRQAANLTQTDIGNKLGVTFQQIQKYENGRNRLSGTRIVQVARLLKVEPGELLGVNGNGPSNEEFEALTDRNTARMVLMLKRLSARQRAVVANAVIELVRAFEWRVPKNSEPRR